MYIYICIYIYIYVSIYVTYLIQIASLCFKSIGSLIHDTFSILGQTYLRTISIWDSDKR